MMSIGSSKTKIRHKKSQNTQRQSSQEEHRTVVYSESFSCSETIFLTSKILPPCLCVVFFLVNFVNSCGYGSRRMITVQLIYNWHETLPEPNLHQLHSVWVPFSVCSGGRMGANGGEWGQALITFHDSLANVLLRCVSLFARLAIRRHAMDTAPPLTPPLSFPISLRVIRDPHRSRASHSATCRASLLPWPFPASLCVRATWPMTDSMRSAVTVPGRFRNGSLIFQSANTC